MGSAQQRPAMWAMCDTCGDLHGGVAEANQACSDGRGAEVKWKGGAWSWECSGWAHLLPRLLSCRRLTDVSERFITGLRYLRPSVHSLKLTKTSASLAVSAKKRFLYWIIIICNSLPQNSRMMLASNKSHLPSYWVRRFFFEDFHVIVVRPRSQQMVKC